MTMLSSFSWVQDFMQSDKMACAKPRPNQVVNLAAMPTLKRKRSELLQIPGNEGSPAKCQRPDLSRHASHNSGVGQSPSKPDLKSEKEQAVQPGVAPAQNVETVLPVVNASNSGLQIEEPQRSSILTKMTTDMRSRVQEKIESQLNLSILLKHNELRLIEQELAKCQVSLEQLRRCQSIPFPGQPGSVLPDEQINMGTGPALEPSAGHSRPEYATPFGVTDGPYTRHYARWLIPDEAFEPKLLPPQPIRQPTGRKSVGGRAVRRSDADKAPVSSARGPRVSIASPMYALPSGYAKARDPNAPLLATRPSDGKTVKLVCKFCLKDHMSSMQGFLNHCRIQHKHEYTSHGAAAEDCGVLLEEGELGNFSAGNEVVTPVSATIPASNKPLVHPFILKPPAEHHNPDRSMVNAGMTDISSSPTSANAPPTIEPASAPSLSFGTGPFVKSTATPHLSALLEKRGASGSLEVIVKKAKDTSDYDNICEQLPSDDEDDAAVAVNQAPGSKPKPRQQSKPKNRRQSIHNSSRANAATNAAPPVPKLKLTLNRPALTGTSMSPGTIVTPNTASPFASSTVDFAQPGFAPRSLTFDASATGSKTTRFGTPEHSERSPTSFDESLQSPGSLAEDAHRKSSFHTNDTNPGLVSDNDDDDDDRLTFATSSVHGEDNSPEAGDSYQDMTMDMNVKVRDNDEENLHTNHAHHEQQDSHDHHHVVSPSATKSSQEPIRFEAGESLAGLARGGNKRGGGRQRGTATGRGKGGSRRTKQNPPS